MRPICRFCTGGSYHRASANLPDNYLFPTIKVFLDHLERNTNVSSAQEHETCLEEKGDEDDPVIQWCPYRLHCVSSSSFALAVVLRVRVRLPMICLSSRISHSHRIMVVDEASMLPVHMAPQILSRAGKQLILCGDPDQLACITHNTKYAESLMSELMRNGVQYSMLKV